ncbi:MAG: hypothetical protein EB127_27145 [Alphaproteobacteria bacterium]|nr:hypothetical protein [Alphaproteobacteria bacterium]
MNKQKLSNLFKLRMYDINDVIQYCIENDIETIVNDFEEKPSTEHAVRDLHLTWKTLLTLKPYDKYSK